MGSGLPLDHFSLLESEPFHELWHWCNGLSKTDAEELSGRSFVRPDTTIIGPGGGDPAA